MHLLPEFHQSLSITVGVILLTDRDSNIASVTEVNVTQSGKVEELEISQGIDEQLGKDTGNVLALENCIS